MIDILVPTYRRPDRVQGIISNVVSTSVYRHKLLFIIENDDHDSVDALNSAQGPFDWIYNEGARSYAGAINTAYRQTSSPWLFCAADDVLFHDDWDAKLFDEHDPWFMVYGTNDLFNPYVLQGMHATHYLVDRSYLDNVGGMVDAGRGSFLNEGYFHNFTDTELVGTAKARAVFKPVLASVVEHMHFGAGKAEKDATYLKGEEGIDEDRRTYEARKHLWWDLTR